MQWTPVDFGNCFATLQLYCNPSLQKANYRVSAKLIGCAVDRILKKKEGMGAVSRSLPNSRPVKRRTIARRETNVRTAATKATSKARAFASSNIGFLLATLVDIERLNEEVERFSTKRTVPLVVHGNENLDALLRWCHAVCGHFNVTVHNFTSCFANGVANCLLVHAYRPDLISYDDIHHSASLPIRGGKTTVQRRSTSLGIVVPRNEKVQKKAWAASFSPTNTAADKAHATAKQRKHNLSLFARSLLSIGHIPVNIEDLDCDQHNDKVIN